MTEFQEGEVSVICRKIILIHGQGPGFCPVGVATINRKFARSRVHNWEGANPEIISLVYPNLMYMTISS